MRRDEIFYFKSIYFMIPWYFCVIYLSYGLDLENVDVPPSPAGGLLRPKLGRLHGWKFLKCPGRRCNQHHGVRCPNHHDHLGLTITSHTWDPGTGKTNRCCSVYWTCNCQGNVEKHPSQFSTDQADMFRLLVLYDWSHGPQHARFK